MFIVITEEVTDRIGQVPFTEPVFIVKPDRVMACPTTNGGGVE
jgi:hypothetical protein